MTHSTKKDGYCLLNAENNFTYDLKNELNCHVPLFSRTRNERIRKHCLQGGLASYIEDNILTIQDGDAVHQIIDIVKIPVTLNGTLSSMVQNILPVCLVGYIHNLNMEIIREFFIEFEANSQTLPGRMNLFDFPNC